MPENEEPNNSPAVPEEPKNITYYYTREIKGSFGERLNRAINDPTLLDLQQDVAMLRALTARFVTELGDRAPDFHELDSIMKATETIGRCCERIAGRQGTMTGKGAAAFIELLLRVVMEEVGQEHPKAALKIADRLKRLGPKDLPAGSIKSGKHAKLASH